jgi:ADP-heptose:LPS heptosyltransferase
MFLVMTSTTAPRLLIIRFSSFGDIAQCMIAAQSFRQRYPDAEVHWAVRSEFKDLVALNPSIYQAWPLWRHKGLKGLWQLAQELRKVHFTHIYDAHSNLRSHLLSWALGCFTLWKGAKGPTHFVRRSKRRWDRFLLFNFRINHFPKPYRGAESFLNPIRVWDLQFPTQPAQFKFTADVEEKCQRLVNQLKSYVVLAPSAAWELKRWPTMHWRELIARIPHPIILLGGPGDGFIKELFDPSRPVAIYNLAGQCTLVDSAYFIANSKTVISADTGVLHLADLLGIPTLALIGPTAFGFPSRPTSRVLEYPLWCRPCTKDGRGKCVNTIYQRCMKEIRPDTVLKGLELSWQPKLKLDPAKNES